MKRTHVILLGIAAIALAYGIWSFVQPGPAISRTARQWRVAGAKLELKARVTDSDPARVNHLEMTRRLERDRTAARGDQDTASDQSLAAVLGEANHFERRHALERLGYEAALRGAGAAIEQLAEITGAADRAAFLRGLFSKLAEGSPEAALRAASEFPRGPDREAAVAALVANWQGDAIPQPKDESMAALLDISDIRLLAKLLGNPTLTVQAAHGLLQGSDRAQLIRIAAVLETANDPMRALSFGRDLQGNERTEFLQEVVRGWAQHQGEAALSWINQETDPALRAQLQVEAMVGWGSADPQSAARRVSEIADAAGRERALQAIAAQWAVLDTQGAFAWANGLPDGTTREKALTAIQTTAPTGIGVSLGTSSEGLPVIQELIPGSPASAVGLLKPGYQIAAIGDGRGGFRDLQGVGLDEVAKLIRGKPGTSAVLQIIPLGGTASNRVTVAVPRQQLLFKNPPSTSGR